MIKPQPARFINPVGKNPTAACLTSHLEP